MGFFSTFKTLPRPLIVVFSLFAVFPVLSFFLFSNPFLASADQGVFRGSLILLAYWFLPLLICSLCLRRAFGLVPIFFIECGLLLFQSIMDVQTQPADVQLIRYVLLLGMTAFTMTFLNKDVLYPLLAGNKRAWRTAPRLYVQVPMLLWYQDDPHHRLPIVVHNCSLSGIGLSGPKEAFQTLLHEKDSLGAFVIYIGFGSKNWMLNVQLIRKREEAAILYAGFRVLNQDVMAKILEEVQLLLPPQKTLRGILGGYWVRRGFRHVVLVLWAVSMASVFMMPGCAHSEQREYKELSLRKKGQPPLNGTAPKVIVSTTTESSHAWRDRALGCVP